jgi:ankyrin repeat protein
MQFYKLAPGARFEFRGRQFTKTTMSMAQDEKHEGNVFQAGTAHTDRCPVLLPEAEAQRWEPDKGDHWTNREKTMNARYPSRLILSLSLIAYHLQAATDTVVQSRKPETSGKQLLSSIATGDLERTKALLASNADPNARDTNGAPALVYASYYGYPEIAKTLIDKGAKVDAAAPDGRTALTWAKTVEVAKVLLDNGANPNSKTTNNATPLLYIVATGNTHLVLLLLAKGAAIDVVESGGATALNQAAARDYTQIVAILLERGASIDLKNNRGLTALDYAARRGSTNTVRMLLEKGAARKIKDAQGLTALDYGRSGGHAGIVTMLTEHSEAGGEHEQAPKPK